MDRVTDVDWISKCTELEGRATPLAPPVFIWNYYLSKRNEEKGEYKRCIIKVKVSGPGSRIV